VRSSRSPSARGPWVCEPAACAAARRAAAAQADRLLAARAAAGDPDAFAALYERWAPRVRRFAAARLGDRDDAEDVAQDVFLALLCDLSSYEGRSQFGTWLFGVAYHMVLRANRRRYRALPVEAVPAAGPPEARLDAVRVLERCARVIDAEASARQAAVFWLTYREGCSGRQVADALQCSHESVRAQLHRLRRLLLDGAPGLEEMLASRAGGEGSGPKPLALAG
jgi:RNA polymerase sigma-70 factor, ECF subfamily